MAVAVRAKQMKLGSPVRGERNAKYNRLMQIENELKQSKGCRINNA
jgi:enolase